MAIFVVEGQTAYIDYQLRADGAIYNLTGHSVAIDAIKLNGTAKSFTGTLTVLEAATGKVRFAPAVGDLVAADSTYQIRIKVTRSDSKIEYFPSGERESWIVQK